MTELTKAPSFERVAHYGSVDLFRGPDGGFYLIVKEDPAGLHSHEFRLPPVFLEDVARYFARWIGGTFTMPSAFGGPPAPDAQAQQIATAVVDELARRIRSTH